MILTNPVGLALLGLAIPVIAFHMLRPRRHPREVSSTFLWEEVAKPVAAARPWQKLPPSLLLLAQLLAVVLLALAVAGPARRTDVLLAPHTVFIIDTSGSMASLDGAPDRLAAARSKAIELRDQLPAGGQASVVAAGDHARVVLTASADKAAFASALDGLRTTAGTGDFVGAFSLASGLETPETPIGFVLISDGGLDPDQQRLLPAGIRYEAVGSLDTNRAITRVSVEQRGSGLHARVSVHNYGATGVTQDLQVDVDGVTAHTEGLDLEPGGREDVEVDLPMGDRVTARLLGGDLLAADDDAHAAVAHQRELRVLVAGPADPFLDELLAVLPGVVVERRDTPDRAEGFDLAVYDGVAVPADPGVPFLAIAPTGGLGDGATGGAVERPALTLFRSDDPLLSQLDLSSLAIAAATQLDLPTAEVLMGAEGAPLLVRGRHANRPYLALSFALADSNLPLDVAWPILADRMLSELAGTQAGTGSLVVGQQLPVNVTEGVTVEDPLGRVIPLTPGEAAPVADRSGFWSIHTDGKPDRLVAVNADPVESAVKPVFDLPVPAVREGTVTGQVSGQEPLLAWVLAPLLLVLIAEGLIARRRVGVSPRQWRIAVVVRTMIAVLVVVAVVAPVLHRPSDEVSTVFLVDGSDSVGPTERAVAVSFVQDALARQPDGTRTAVALFGGDARLELALGTHPELAVPTVKIDPTRTNLAAALRLASAVLPSDARRRIVLLSDGRATEGDVLTEADILRGVGVQVDVVPLDVARAGDTAVDGLEAPALAHVGENVDVVAHVVASEAGPATVTLDRDGELVGEQTVDLQVGDNSVTFTDTMKGEGVARYRVRITSATNSVKANDVGFAAVRIDGAAKVLVVEGSVGESATLVSALRAGGANVDVLVPADLPALDRLTDYSSTVLVDVDASQLSSTQIGSLAAATRDLGHGLITVGGTHAYGLGGYRNSDLEALLPVISEITDPKRKQRVAEVLAIDTSGSMASCHCASGDGNMGGPRLGGGVRKTDIARAGAARAIDAMDKNDEIGLLAVDQTDRWVMDLQQVPSEDVVREGLRQITPSGGTNLATTLETAAKALRTSKANLKHIILFTDGFTDQRVLSQMATEAKRLHDDEGITVSILATGEGSAQQLEEIARAGGGRFYPGHDLQNIPQILQQEAMIASRDFVNEGEFLPEITSNDAAVRNLTEAPPLLGYVATTAKPVATTHLKIGAERDPLLASWQVGLGKATSWTSDAGDRWGKHWASWDGFVSFWTTVVKDTYPTSSGAGVRATVDHGRLKVRIESAEAFPDGATATARVTSPDLVGRDLPLERLDARTFGADLPVSAPGTYAVGAEVVAGGDKVGGGTALANLGYSAEYLPGESQPDVLRQVSERTQGRGVITAAQAFEPGSLPSGTSAVALAGWALLAAALLWPLAVALSRITLARAVVRGARAGSGRRRGINGDRRTGAAAADAAASGPTGEEPKPPPTGSGPPGPSAGGPSALPGPARTAPVAETPPSGDTATVDQLLARKRERRGGPP